jgi:hypothetical protein
MKLDEVIGVRQPAMNPEKRKLLIATSPIAVAALIACLYIALKIRQPHAPIPRPQRTAEIQAAINDRAKNPKTLVGLGRDQIHKELGPPDRLNRAGKDDISYYLGPEGGFISIDSRWLMIVFKDGTAVKAVINTD